MQDLGSALYIRHHNRKRPGRLQDSVCTLYDWGYLVRMHVLKTMNARYRTE